MNLLHLDSSFSPDNSATRELSAALVANFPEKGEVRYRDLARDPIAHLTPGAFSGSDPDSERSMADFLWADTIVIGAPMYNFAIPSTLKAWIDRVAVAGKTFRYTAQGPEGLAGGKRVIVASARGGVYGDNSPADFQEAYLRQVFSFLGITDIEFVRAEGVAVSAQQREAAMKQAHEQIEQAVAA